MLGQKETLFWDMRGQVRTLPRQHHMDLDQRVSTLSQCTRNCGVLKLEARELGLEEHVRALSEACQRETHRSHPSLPAKASIRRARLS